MKLSEQLAQALGYKDAKTFILANLKFFDTTEYAELETLFGIKILREGKPNETAIMQEN